MWEGECFVFDERVSLNDKLEKGYIHNVLLGSAITYVDTKSSILNGGILP